jgi:sarcosine oxidase subunit gamma
MLESTAGRHKLPGTTPLDAAGRLRTLPPSTRFVLRCRPAAVEKAEAAFALALPLAPCRATTAGGRAALWLGPDEWLLLAPEADASEIARLGAALAGVPHSFVDIGHGWTGLGIEGPQAAAVLNHGCPLDLSSAAFPVSMCTRTILGKAQIVLWRTAEDAFRIEMARSFGAYVWSFLEEARREHNVGFSARDHGGRFPLG